MSSLRELAKCMLALLVFECLIAVNLCRAAEIEMGKVPPHDALKATTRYHDMLETIGVGLTDPLNKRALLNSLGRVSTDEPIVTRGAKETSLYKRASSGVVLVVTNDRFGSGVVISADGKILTNWHVVAGYKEVGVVFKPAKEGQEMTAKDIYRAKVVQIDEVTDLALLRVSTMPPTITVLQLGTMSQVQVGADVHAIGHPTGEAWTYTKGIISQIRDDYEWVTPRPDGKITHRADVIQTQTPINPGNSGGPLLSDNGTIIGLNSFKASGEGLNFAVAVDEVKRFLSRGQNRYALVTPPPSGNPSEEGTCEVRFLGETRNEKNGADRVYIDANCDGKAEGYIEAPDNPKKGITLSLDTDGDKLIDVVIFDADRDGKWDISFYNFDGTGNPQLVGYHPDGSIKASKYITYEDWLKEK